MSVNRESRVPGPRNDGDPSDPSNPALNPWLHRCAAGRTLTRPDDPMWNPPCPELGEQGLIVEPDALSTETVEIHLCARHLLLMAHSLGRAPEARHRP